MKALIQKILVVCLMVTGVAGNAWGADARWTNGGTFTESTTLNEDGVVIPAGKTVTVNGDLKIVPNKSNNKNITLTVKGTLVVTGSIILDSYDRGLAWDEYYGKIENSGTINAGAININNGGNSLTSTGALNVTGDIANKGTFTSSGAVSVSSISNSKNFTNNGPLTILGNLENNGTLKSSTNLTIPSSLTGSGTIDLSNATNPKLTVGSANSTITVKMGNNAQISANSGDLKLGSVTVGTNSSIHTAGSLTTTGGTIGGNTSLSIGKDFTNGSTLVVSDALDIPGNFTNNGTVTIQDVTFVVGTFSDDSNNNLVSGGNIVNNGTININTSSTAVANGDFGYMVSNNLTNEGTINLNSGYIKADNDVSLNEGSYLNFKSGDSGVLVYGDMAQRGGVFEDDADIKLSNNATGIIVVAGTYTDESNGTFDHHPWGHDSDGENKMWVDDDFSLAANIYDYQGIGSLIIVRNDADMWRKNGVFRDEVETLTQKILETLPIELVYFRAQQDDGNVEFAWQTASELNNDYFTIEYSFNAVDFEELAIVAGAGTTTETVDYQYTEFSAKHTGTVYYRLKQTDYDGEFTYSDMIALTFAEKEFDEEISAIVVYPNPATDIINVKGQFEQIAVCDFNGRVLDVASQGENTLNVSNLPSGTYYVKVTTEGEQRLIPFVKR